MQGSGDPPGVSPGDGGEVKLCRNCKKDIAAANFTIHEVHCVRNIKLCPRCDEPVVKSEYEQHFDSEHALVGCPDCKTQVAKSELNKHIVDFHSRVVCKKCGDEVDRNALEQHEEDEHATATCPLCNTEVKKNLLDYHQMNDCSKRHAACRFCNMDCLVTEFKDHEDYCGSRTEQCKDCGRFIMVREMQLHTETNCLYPEMEPKNEESQRREAMNSWFNSNGIGFTDHHPLERILSGGIGRRHRNVFRDFFGEPVPSALPFPVPPFLDDPDVGQPGPRPHVHTVDVDGDDDDSETGIPCEFCGNLYALKQLQRHQTRCALTHVPRSVSPVALETNHSSRPYHGDSATDAPHPDDDVIVIPPDSDNDEDGPVIVDDDRPAADSDNAMSSGKKPAELQSDGVTDSHDKLSLIPCEFCLDLFDSEVVSQHQDVCFRQQKEMMEALLAAGPQHEAGATERYRYPFSVMSLEERERLINVNHQDAQDIDNLYDDVEGPDD